MLSVGAVRPLPNAAPLGGAGMVDVRQQRADVKDDVFLMRARGPMDRPGTCCARLDDFDWVVPPYVPNLVLPGWDVDVGATDVSRDVRGLPEVFPVVAEETAAGPMSWPVVVKTEPQVGCESDVLLSEWEVVDIADISRDIRCLPDVFPVMLDRTAAGPMTLHLDVEMGPQADEGPDVVLAGWDMERDDTGVIQNTRLLTDVYPMMFEDPATEPMSLPVVVNTETQVDGSPLRQWSL